MRYLLLLLFLFCGSAQAQTVGLHIISGHTNGGMNNFNPGLYVRLGNDVTFGTFRNSHRQQSAYVGYTFEARRGSVSAALTLGVITGYPSASVMPMAVPSVAYHFGKHAVRVGIVPKPPIHGSSAAVHLMFERQTP